MGLGVCYYRMDGVKAFCGMALIFAQGVLNREDQSGTYSIVGNYSQ
jgi:hypothetical protein